MSKVATNTKDELLNIKQAAALLNVSEVSLRRWTTSGRLACMRIGRKRERRFRREDLMNFLENETATDINKQHSTSPTKTDEPNIVLEGMTINYGSHLCSFYESDLGRLKLSVPYLADGLRNGDICYLIASPDARNEILKNLKEIYQPIDSAIEDGKLVLSDGMDSPHEMYDYFEYNFIMAVREGNQALRVLGDMSWCLDKGLDISKLVEFETRYNHSLAHQFPVISLCQYDARRFSGTEILNALKCHKDTFHYPLAHFLGV